MKWLNKTRIVLDWIDEKRESSRVFLSLSIFSGKRRVVKKISQNMSRKLC